MVDGIKDIGLASIFLLVGYAMRPKVKVFQKLYIPAAVIGGIIGPFLGPEVLSRFSPFCLHFSEGIGTYANPFLAIVFSGQFLGASFNRDTLKHSGATFFLNFFMICMQVTLGLLIVQLFLPGNDQLYSGFGLFPHLSFYGGYSICASTAGVFGDTGFFPTDLGASAGNTFATIDLIYGFVVGIVIIARKGLISQKAGMQNLTEVDMKGYVEPEHRQNIIVAITKNDVLNPVALHVAVMGVVMCLAYWLLPYMQKIPHFGKPNITIPVLIVSIVLNVLAKQTGLNKFLDNKSLKSITSVARI